MSAGAQQTPSIETALEEFKSLHEQIIGHQTQIQGDLKANGEVSAENAKKQKELEQKLNGEAQRIIELGGRLGELEKRLDRFGKIGGDVEQPESMWKSLGEIFVESTEHKEARASKLNTCTPVEIEGGLTRFIKAAPGRREMKALTRDAGSAGALLDPMYVAEIFAPRLYMPRLIDFVRIIGTTRDSIEFVRASKFVALQTALSAQENAGETVLSVDNTSGFYDGQEIVIAKGEVSEETRKLASTNAVDHTNKTITVTVATTNTHAKGVTISADTFVYTPQAELIPSGAQSFDLINRPIKDLGHDITVARQLLDDRPALQDHLEYELPASMALSRERQMLYGDNSERQLDGFFNQTDLRTYLWSNGLPGDTEIDAIRRGITLANKAEYPTTGIVMSHLRWERVETAKADDGHYLVAMIMTLQGPRLWAAPIAPTAAINDDDCLCGAFSLGARYYDREEATLRYYDQHEDYAKRRLVLLSAEERGCLAINRPEAFTNVKFDSAPPNQ